MRAPRSVPATLALTLAALVAAALWPSFAPAAATEVDPDLAAVGKVTYRIYCANCHGRDARGDGPVAEYLTVEPADLTQIAPTAGGEFPFDEIYGVIDGQKPVPGHGRQEMPVWGEVFQSGGEEGADAEEVRAKITQLVHYLASIQKPAG